jgi:DnaK suppressor protein
MIDEIARYSDADLAEFKELILKKIAKAQADLD